MGGEESIQSTSVIVLSGTVLLDALWAELLSHFPSLLITTRSGLIVQVGCSVTDVQPLSSTKRFAHKISSGTLPSNQPTTLWQPVLMAHGQ